jgi:predicted transcriptional regulator
MRIPTVLLCLAILPTVSFGQVSDLKVPVRHGVTLNIRSYPQGTPKETLASVIKAIEDSRFDVLVAHLIEEQLIEKRAAEHGKQLEGDAEKKLEDLRKKQLANPLSVPKGERLPNEVQAFNAIIREEAKEMGFQATIDEVKKKYAGDLSLVKELKRYLRDGEVGGSGDNAKITLKGVPGKAVFLVRVNNRWFIEDRQEEKDEKKP